MSAPAQNEAPSPESVTTRMDPSRPRSRKASDNSRATTSLIALRASGLERMTPAEPFSRETRIVWKGPPMSHPEDREARLGDRRFEARRERESEDPARLRRRDHT